MYSSSKIFADLIVLYLYGTKDETFPRWLFVVDLAPSSTRRNRSWDRIRSNMPLTMV